MNEGGANEPTPIVHNGIIYLTNTGQHRCRRSMAGPGDLIWENRYRPANRRRRLRGDAHLAIYEDKVFVATTDARIVGARRAHRRKIVWETDHRRSPKDRLQQYQRPDRRQRQGDCRGWSGASQYTKESCFISAYDAARRASGSGSSTRSRARASRAATPGAACPTCCAPAARPGSPAATIRS